MEGRYSIIQGRVEEKSFQETQISQIKICSLSLPITVCILTNFQTRHYSFRVQEEECRNPSPATLSCRVVVLFVVCLFGRFFFLFFCLTQKPLSLKWVVITSTPYFVPKSTRYCLLSNTSVAEPFKHILIFSTHFIWK